MAGAVRDLTFPLLGLDLGGPHGGQRPGTTPHGVNVRTFEPLTGRGRGGSRPGLAKYIPAPVDTAGFPVQHLNVIVDPQAPALMRSDTAPLLVADPSDGGRNLLSDGSVRLVRQGGSAAHTHKDAEEAEGETSEITYLQSASLLTVQTDDGPSRTDSVPFPAAVAAGDLILVVVNWGPTFPDNELGVIVPTDIEDTVGTTFAEAVAVTGSGSDTLYLFYGIAPESGPNTVAVSLNNLAGSSGSVGHSNIIVAAYRNTAALNPLDATAADAFLVTNSTAQTFTFTPGPVATTSDGELIVAVFATPFVGLAGPWAFTPGPAPGDETDPTPSARRAQSYLRLIDLLPVKAAAPGYAPNVLVDRGETSVLSFGVRAIGASFKWKGV